MQLARKDQANDFVLRTGTDPLPCAVVIPTQARRGARQVCGGGPVIGWTSVLRHQCCSIQGVLLVDQQHWRTLQALSVPIHAPREKGDEALAEKDPVPCFRKAQGRFAFARSDRRLACRYEQRKADLMRFLACLPATALRTTILREPPGVVRRV